MALIIKKVDKMIDYKKELKEFIIDLLDIENEICQDFNLTKINSDSLNRYEIDTVFGLYRFYFDKDSIMGRFEDFNNELIIKYNGSEFVNGTLYYKKHTINSFSGKFNFHYSKIYDFQDEIYRISLLFQDKKTA